MSKPTKTYLIKLTPLNYYFFGGERTFGGGNLENYLVESRKLPQQTTLLGTIRYRLLVDNLLNGTENTLGKKLPSGASEYIGAHGFIRGYKGIYGCISRLSTLFIIDNKGKHYHSAALNCGLSLKAMHNSSAALDMRHATQTTTAFQLSGYDAKEGLQARFIEKGGAELFFEKQRDKKTGIVDDTKDVLFVEHEQVGIQKSRTGNPDEKAFFKQTSYCLKKHYAFGFYLTLGQTTDGKFPELREGTIQMGGERSLFKMEIAEAREKVPILYKTALPTDEYDKLVLLSDADLSPSIYQYCDFSIIRTIPFRHLVTSVADTAQYLNLNEEDRSYKAQAKSIKSRRSNLVQRGSVFYVKKGCMDKVKNELEKAIAFRNIGYNQYFIHSKSN